MKELGLPALSLLNLLLSKEVIELRLVLDAVVNPRYEDFDFEKAKFDLPLLSILRHCLDLITIPDKKDLGVIPYPFSKKSDRREFSNDYESHVVALILQSALSKGKTLLRDYDHLLNKGGVALVKGQSSKLLQASLSGFLEDIIVGFSDLDLYTVVSDIEDTLYQHSKYRHITYHQSMEILDRVEGLIFRFTFKTEISRAKFVRESSPILSLLRKSEGNILIPY
jgi:hypothetical protein